MILLFSFCNLAWWQVLLSWLLPFLLGWWFARLLRASFASDEDMHHTCKDTISSLKGQLKECDERLLKFEHEANSFVNLKSEYESKIRDLSLQANSIAPSVNLKNTNQHEFDLLNKRINEINDELVNCRNKYLDLEKEYSVVLSKLDSCKLDLKTEIDRRVEFANSTTVQPVAISDSVGLTTPIIEAKIESTTNIPDSAFNALKNDNLQIIEGIGPKMDEFLKTNGIHNWTDLASADATNIKFKLDAADSKYRIIDPTTWAAQAGLARDGRWEDLISFQKNLTAGKDNATHETNSKLEAVLVKLGLLKKFAQDDLKAVEGIGPKIEGLLHEAGIKTWKGLSNTTIIELKTILANAGERYQLADPSTWAKQAAMAAEGQWKELFEYQDRLDGGKEV